MLAGAVAGAKTLINIASTYLALGQVNMVLLKQIRDAPSDVATVFSSVTAAQAEIVALRGFGVLGGGYELELANFDSQPIAQDFGLVAGPQNSLAGIWAALDWQLAV